MGLKLKNKNMFICYLCIGWITFSACYGTEKRDSIKKNFIPVKIDTIVSSTVKMNLHASVVWGSGIDQIEPAIQKAPFFGFVSPEQVRKTYDGVFVKSDEKGGIHLRKIYINYDVTKEKSIPIVHFSPDGKFSKKTEVPLLNEPGLLFRGIYDYVCDSENNIYLLEALSFKDSYVNRLVKIDSDGKVIWDIRGDHSDTLIDYGQLQGVFGSLLLTDGTRLFLVPYPGEGRRSLAEININTGKIKKTYYFSGGNTNRICINDRGKVVRSFYNPELRELYFGFYDTDSKKETNNVDSSRIWGDMIGFDNKDNAYTISYNGFGKMGADGHLKAKLLIRDVIVRKDDKSVYTNWVTKDSISVIRYYPSGKILKYSFERPAKKSPEEAYDNYRLAHVDKTGCFYYHTGEVPGYAGRIVVISEKGEIVKEMLSPFDLFSIESHLHQMEIHIDTKGNIYLPVTDPEGVKIVKLSF